MFLTLLLLALSAPAGMVVAGESPAPYVVLFDSTAVGREDRAARPAMNGWLTAHPVAPVGVMTETLDVDPELVARHVADLGARTGIREVADVYTSAVGGFAAELTPSQVRAIEADPAVSLVLADVPVSLDPGLAGDTAGRIRTTAKPNVRVPPGVRRVGARNMSGGQRAGRGQRVNADVAIIDTGVQRNHPDLNVVGGYNCTSRNRGRWDDNNGHGTHVAGIVGARDNSFGVTGVAPSARLWSVKVLDGRGHGFLSWVVCGVDWVSAQRERGGRARIEVANMSLSFSLGGGAGATCRRSPDPLRRAICRSVARGTVYVVAAGNESRNARRNRPAAYDEVITVSAMADYDGRGGGRARRSSCSGRDDGFASFSNYGPDVDLIAPGTCVLSTFTRKRYAWMSGTSMAAPHVAGAAAVYRTRFRGASPSQVRRGLQAMGKLDWRTATDPDRIHEKAVWIGSFRSGGNRRGTRHASFESAPAGRPRQGDRDGGAASVENNAGRPAPDSPSTASASRSTQAEMNETPQRANPRMQMTITPDHRSGGVPGRFRMNEAAADRPASPPSAYRMTERSQAQPATSERMSLPRNSSAALGPGRSH